MIAARASRQLAGPLLMPDTEMIQANSQTGKPPAVNGATWREATASNPCPKCNKPGWCRTDKDGDWCCCRRVADGAYEERQDKTGDTFWLHRLTPWPDRDWPAPIYSVADGKGERAGPDVLHRLYAAVLEQLPLSTPHAEALRRRGLDDEALRDGGYGTLGRGRGKAVQELVRRGLEKHFPTVPGFFVQEKGDRRWWTLAGAGGTLIPVRDEAGRVAALMARRDDGGPGPRYTFLSSMKRGGPGPGGSRSRPQVPRRPDHGPGDRGAAQGRRRHAPERRPDRRPAQRRRVEASRARAQAPRREDRARRLRRRLPPQPARRRSPCMFYFTPDLLSGVSSIGESRGGLSVC